MPFSECFFANLHACIFKKTSHATSCFFLGVCWPLAFWQSVQNGIKIIKIPIFVLELSYIAPSPPSGNYKISNCMLLEKSLFNAPMNFNLPGEGWQPAGHRCPARFLADQLRTTRNSATAQALVLQPQLCACSPHRGLALGRLTEANSLATIFDGGSFRRVSQIR